MKRLRAIETEKLPPLQRLSIQINSSPTKETILIPEIQEVIQLTEKEDQMIEGDHLIGQEIDLEISQNQETDHITELPVKEMMRL